MAIVREINAAQTGVLVQAYLFSSAPIAKALVAAHRRGVNVQAVLDFSNGSDVHSAASFLARAGVPTFLDANYKVAHNKVMIIDGEVVLTGSFNFTKGAELFNGENLLVIRDKLLAAKYTANWQRHRSKAEPYTIGR